MLRSGALAIRSSRISKFPLKNPFLKGNVGVLESLNCIVFKSLEFDPTAQWTSDSSIPFHQFESFIEKTLLEQHKASPSQLPLQMEMYLQDLQQPNIDEDAIVDHPTTMTNLHHDALCVDTFTYLLRDDTAPSGDVTAVLTAVGAGHPMGLHHAHKHEFLYQFLPYPMRKQLYHGKSYPFTGVNVPKLTDAELGEVIVGICRHLITHGRDKDVRTLCKKISTSLHTPMIS